MFVKRMAILVSCVSGFSLAQQDIVQQQRPSVVAEPTALDWRKVQLPELSYSRLPVSGGAEMIVVPFPTEKMFRVQFLFPGGVYSTARDMRVPLQAAVDLMVMGGFGEVTASQVEKTLMDKGLSVGTFLTAQGRFSVTIEGLAKDALAALDTLEDILLKPRYDADALNVWKKNRDASFESFLMAGQMRQQMRFMEQQMVSHIFGPNHDFASLLTRMAPKATAEVTLPVVKKLGDSLVTRTNTSLIVAGQLTPALERKAKTLLEKLPRKEATLISWLPQGPLPSSLGKPRALFVQKPDMNQSQVMYRVHFPKTRDLSPLDEAKLLLAMEVFSSSGGVIGNDRFSKAIRSDSGLSYMAHASCQDSYLKPAWALLTCSMVFQSPNNRVTEAIQVAHRTWQDFLQFGITADEFKRARTMLMNRLLARELTPFDKLGDVVSALEEGRSIPTLPFERALLRLEGLTDHTAVNQLLTELHRDPQAAAVAVMGPGEEKTLEAVKALPWVDGLHKVDFDSIVKALK